MEMITLDVWLYGPLAQYADEASRRAAHANVRMVLPAGSKLADLLAQLDLPTEERGITFINGTLSAMPGVQPDLDRPLCDGDRVALFHLKSMWPFQYRDGAALSPELRSAMQSLGGVFHQQARE